MVPGIVIVQLITLFKIFNKQKASKSAIQHLRNQIRAETGRLSTSFYFYFKKGDEKGINSCRLVIGDINSLFFFVFFLKANV